MEAVNEIVVNTFEIALKKGLRHRRKIKNEVENIQN